MAFLPYSIYPAAFVVTGTPNVTTDLLQMHSIGVQPDSSKSVIIPGGALDAGAVIASHSEPRVRLSTRDLTTLIGAVSGTVGLNCTAGATFRWQKRATGGAFTAGAAHVTMTSTAGFLWIDRLRARQNDPEGASADLVYAPFYDGTNLPLVINVSQTISGVTPTFTSAFYLGPVYLGAAKIEGVTGWEIDPGLEFRTVPADGEPHPKVGVIVARRPTLTFDLLTVDYLSTITSLFGNAFASAISGYAWKGVSGGSRVAAASLVHFKWSIASGDWTPDDVSVQGNDDASVRVMVRCTAAPTYSITSAIP